MKKTKYGDYEKIITFPVYSQYQVHVVFSTDVGKSKIKRYGGELPCGDALCFHTNDGHTHMFLPLRVIEGTVAHEAVHALQGIMEYIGAKNLDDEIMAYHIGHIVEEIYKFKKEIKTK